MNHWLSRRAAITSRARPSSRISRAPGVALAVSLGLVALALGGARPALAQGTLSNPSTPTFNIVNPFFNGVAQGPVGTHVTVQATSGWDPSATIVISVTPSSSTCGSTTPPPVPAQTTSTVGQDGSFMASFSWPSDANAPGNYLVCASEEGSGTLVGTSSGFFTVLSPANGQPSSAPALSVAVTTAHIGDQVTVSGANWLPAQPVQLRLQYANKPQDPGDVLQTVNSNPDGTFSAQVTLTSQRTGTLWIIGLGGQPFGTQTIIYPLMTHSQPLTIGQAPTPTPTIVPPTPTVVPTATTRTTGTTPSKSQELLIALLGLISVVLLSDCIVVAVLALRGRSPRGPEIPGGGDGWGGSGPRAPGWTPNYNSPGSPWDETQAGPPPQGNGVGAWDDAWQQPPGQPWSGRGESRPYRGPVSRPPASPFDDEMDDPYRTRMGDPPAPPPPPPSRPYNSPPPSRPNPGGTPWDDDPGASQQPTEWQPRR